MIENTDERVIPELMKHTNPSLLEHIARYQFALEYIHGHVLDLACGVGYGAHMIAKSKKKQLQKVIGIDIDQATITYAKQTYYHPLVTYQHENAVDPFLPDKLGTFDAITSFETLEHVEEEEQFLANIFNMLKPNGTLVISTPFGEGRGKPCGSPFHVHQLTVPEFKDLFHSYQDVSFYGQNGVLIEPLESKRTEHLPIGIAVCKK
ncbi:class I SAM-dependent methyltransferase [Bacillus mesophilus]|uniref:Class I SAM-dependent methyltransferase n=1 Tax=Bacillus mesophilus TaxID=1808955 RepID=A0A6M0QER8_9BACI|nr:class I SAM-dependent methyltransferase [Bacillus mesophilus]NEY73818.1 class I SAM-dependent methyltransferase [Bacillus mesophilus]